MSEKADDQEEKNYSRKMGEIITDGEKLGGNPRDGRDRR